MPFSLPRPKPSPDTRLPSRRAKLPAGPNVNAPASDRWSPSISGVVARDGLAQTEGPHRRPRRVPVDRHRSEPHEARQPNHKTAATAQCRLTQGPITQPSGTTKQNDPISSLRPKPRMSASSISEHQTAVSIRLLQQPRLPALLGLDLPGSINSSLTSHREPLSKA